MKGNDSKRLDELPVGTTFSLYARRGDMMTIIEGTTISLDSKKLEQLEARVSSAYSFIVSDVSKRDGYTVLFDVNDIQYSIIAYDPDTKRTYEWCDVHVFRYTIDDKKFDLFATRCKGHRVDRRGAFRVPINKSCVISLGDHKGTLYGEVIDLSTTGVLIRVADKDCRLDVGDTFSIQFTDNLVDKHSSMPFVFKMSAKIVRIHNSVGNGSTSYGCVLTSYNINKMSSYVVQKQMAQIQRSKANY